MGRRVAHNWGRQAEVPKAGTQGMCRQGAQRAKGTWAQMQCVKGMGYNNNV